MPGDNMSMTVDADCADRDGRGAAVRDSRGRPHRRRRRRREGHRVVRVRPVAQLAERRSPKPQVGGSIPSWPASSSIGRAAVSKTAGWGFDSLLACHAAAGMAAAAVAYRSEILTDQMDKLKIALAVACVVAGVWGYYYFAETALVLRVLMVMGGLRRRRRRRVAVGARQGVLRLRAGSLGGSRPRVVADAQGDDADHGDRVRLRRDHGAVPVRRRHDARVDREAADRDGANDGASSGTSCTPTRASRRACSGR